MLTRQRHDHARHPRGDTAIDELAARQDLNRKPVAKWGKRYLILDAAMDRKPPRSAVLTGEGEAIAVAVPKLTLLPRNEGLCARQATIPQPLRFEFVLHGVSKPA